MNRKSQDTFGNVALILAAIVMAGSVAWRVWSRGEVPPPAGAELRRIADGEWKEALDLGIALDAILSS